MRLNEEGQKRLKRGSAISACELLRPDVYTTSSQAYQASAAYLDGRRLNEWKFKTPGHYCYMYDDPEQQMQDYAMVGPKRDIISSAPFVTRTFSSSEIDDAHAGPIKKHVMQIDPSKITQDSLRSFWEQVGENRCESLTGPLLHDTQTTHTDIQNKYRLKDRLNKTLIPLRSKVKNLDQQAVQEEAVEAEWKRNFEGYKISLNYAQNKHLTEEEQLSSRRDKLSSIRANHTKCTPVRDRCLDELEVLNANVNQEAQWNDDLAGRKNGLEREVNQKRERTRQIDDERARCSALLTENNRKKKNLEDFLDTVHKQQAGCDTDRSLVREDMLKTQAKLAKVKKLEETCLQEQNKLKADRKTCLQQSQKCTFLNDSYDQIKANKEYYEKQLEECNNKIAQSESTIDMLKRYNVNHYNELQSSKMAYQQALLESKNLETSESKSLTDWIAGDFDNLVTQASENAAKIQGCKSKSKAAGDIERIESENARLQYMIDSLELESCKYCVPSLNQCSGRFLNDPYLCGNTKYEYDSPLLDAKKSPVVITNPSENRSPSQPTFFDPNPNPRRGGRGGFDYDNGQGSLLTSVPPQPEPDVDTGPGGGCVIS